MIAVGVTIAAFGLISLALWASVRFTRGPAPLPSVFAAIPRKSFDWFLWESEQIQHGGYVFWFDHWRYEGEPGAYLDPTPQERARVFQASLARARESYGEERLSDLIALAVERLSQTGLSAEAAYDRVRHMGQDPVRVAIDIAEGRGDPDLILVSKKGLH